MLSIKNNYTNFSFKAGLTPKIKENFAKLSAPGIAQSFRTVGVDADFGYNRPIACCCAATNDIFDCLCRNYNLPFWAKPPSIRLFNKDNVLFPDMQYTLGFCLTDSSPVLKNQPTFEVRSVFYNDKYKSLNDIDKEAENNYQIRWNSTNHFLHTYIHEWVHNIHDDMLYRTFGYDGNCPRARARYNTVNGLPYDPNPFVNGVLYLTRKIFPKKYTNEEREKIVKEVSHYAAGRIYPDGTSSGGNPFEVVAEYITKKVVDSLDENTLMPKRNPFSTGNDSDEIREIFAKAWSGII